MAAKSSRSAGRRRGGSPAAPPKLSAFDAGIRLLARRPYASAELGRRLLRIGYEEEAVRSALKTFVELGYVDDAQYADLFVAGRAGRRGPRALAGELSARGIDREIVDAAVTRFGRDTQVRLAAELVRRHVGSNLPEEYDELLEREGPRLLRRGYSHSIAFAACHAVWTGRDDLLTGA